MFQLSSYYSAVNKFLLNVVNVCLITLLSSPVLSVQMGGVTPLHIAADLNSKEGVMIIKMLLTCLANTDIRALDDGSYLHLNPVFLFVSLN